MNEKLTQLHTQACPKMKTTLITPPQFVDLLPEVITAYVMIRPVIEYLLFTDKVCIRIPDVFDASFSLVGRQVRFHFHATSNVIMPLFP